MMRARGYAIHVLFLLITKTENMIIGEIRDIVHTPLPARAKADYL